MEEHSNNVVELPRPTCFLIDQQSAPLRVVLSSISSDSHTWNLVFMQLLLEFMGHEVDNLGACTPDELIAERCARGDIDLLVISSVNGHGNIDGERLIKQLRQNARIPARLPAVIGGKLGINGGSQAGHVERLLRAGFDAVFDAACSLDQFESFVKRIASRDSAPAALEVAA